MFEVILSPEARVFFAQADKPLAQKLARCFAQLERDPRRHNNIKGFPGNSRGKYAIALEIGESSIALTIRRGRCMSSSSHIAARYTNE